MAALSAEQVAAAAYLGGFRGVNDLVNATAVAFAESSWNPAAANPCCKGLWQINLSAHPGMSKNVLDPVQNAKYAYQIFRAAGGWCTSGKPPSGCNPWQGYGNSNYQSKKAESAKAVADLIGRIAISGPSAAKSILGNSWNEQINSGASDAAKAVLGPAEVLISAFNRMGKWITNPDNLMRIFKVVMGGVIIIVGGAALMDRQIVNVAGGVVSKVVKSAT